MLHLTRNDNQNFWNIVKDTRENFLFKNIDPKCFLTETLLDTSFVENIMNVMQETVQLNATIEPIRNVTNKTLETAVEMYTYLFFCPPNDIISFYKHLLNTGSAKDIVIALSKFLKISQNAVKESSYKIFLKYLATMNLKQHEINDEEDIKSLLKEITIQSQATNHPVHVLEETGQVSSTALIPFCDFGGNMSVMGVKIEKFYVPFCKSFKAKIIQDQLCYSVDPNKYRNYLKGLFTNYVIIF